MIKTDSLKLLAAPLWNAQRFTIYFNRAIDLELNRIGKTNLKRIVSMLTRLIQRTEMVSEVSIEYEYEYRDAEYEYEKKHEQCGALKSPPVLP